LTTTRLAISALLSRDGAQNSLEYLIVIGTVVVAIAAALFVGFPSIAHQVMGFICPAVDTAVGSPPVPSAVGACISGGP